MAKINKNTAKRVAEKAKNVYSKLKEKCKSIKVPDWQILKSKATEVTKKIGGISYKELCIKTFKKVRNFRISDLKKNKTLKKLLTLLAGSGKFVISAVVTFLFFYYFIGSSVVENIDVKSGYKADKAKIPTFETAKTMSFLIKREIDDKMWTPNLPIVFPAYALDNMPNFQKGIIAGVRDISSALVDFSKNTEAQKIASEKAYKLLSYAPDIWLMSRKGAFNLAPSSNSQYRKAAKELRVFNAKGIFVPNEDDLKLLLSKISIGLQRSVLKNENRQQKHSGDWFDTKADDLFYYNKGYAFALWQITRILASDYKETLLQHNLYEEWTHLVAILEKTAELSPRVVRNGKPDSLFSPNHLLMQNNYLLQAIISVKTIDENLLRNENAN